MFKAHYIRPIDYTKKHPTGPEQIFVLSAQVWNLRTRAGGALLAWWEGWGMGVTGPPP